MNSADNPLQGIEDAKHSGTLLYCGYALRRMLERNFHVGQIEEALNWPDVEILENYPRVGRPSPECLILGKDGQGKFIHILVAYPVAEIITVYEPDLPKWKSPRERTKKNEL
jgi:hypothetical protein